jgi:hypothetical protein
VKQRKSYFRLAPIILNVCLIIMPIVIIGCGTTNSVAESQPESIQPAAPAIESPPEDSADESLEQSNEPIKAPENANYTITFNATWSAETHSDFYVTNAHFSPFVAYSHNGSPESHIFEIGSVASQAIEEMAETGETGLLESEIQSRVTSGSILAWVKGRVFDSPGVDQANLDFTQSHNQVIFVSMIAPSPDWFVAVQANLFDGVKWSEEIVLELVSYDAGTDSGTDLSSADIDTNPRQVITVFPEILQHLGTVTLTLNSSDS